MKKIDLIHLWKVKKRPLVLDGSIGGVLQSQIKDKNLLWSSWLNVENPDAVRFLHNEYVKSGAEIITTNTFRTNPYFYNKYKLKYSLREFVAAGVNLAKAVRGDNEILIAGSNPPAEDCYQAERSITFKELEFNHRSHINILFETGVDFILNETQSHFDELKIICRHCSGNKIQYVISLFVTDELRILSGEPVLEVIEFIAKYNPAVIAFNCFRPNTYKELFDILPKDILTGFYLNCGTGAFTDENITCHIPPDEYVEFSQKYITDKTVFVGSCCGSNPAHTQKIREYLDEQN